MSRRLSYNGIPAGEMKQFLEEKYLQYNNPSFIEPDPISIPHRFTLLQDREIAGFLTAAIAWGRRDLILRSANHLIEMMGDSPYKFLISADRQDFLKFKSFVHRTFNGLDCIYFLEGLSNIYKYYGSMEDIVLEGMNNGTTFRDGISCLRDKFFSLPHAGRTEKHFADVKYGAAGKRLNMFLRWMVRNDGRGVDFGIWKRISPALLYIPLDLHSGNTARKLGLLKRKMNDWKAVEELTDVLRTFDENDPAKYDFALFGIGVNKGF
jgi:uncharacterized protein (TIGR02757 family)